MISCPHCGKQYRDRPELAGKNVKCANCEESFVAVAEAAAMPPEVPPVVERPVDDSWQQNVVMAHTEVPDEEDEETSNPAQWLVWFLDIDFERYITPRLVSIAWVIALIVMVAGGFLQLVLAVWAVARSGSSTAFAAAAGTLFLSLLLGLLWLIALRVCCEMITVFFKMANLLRSINRQTAEPVQQRTN